MEKLPHSKSCFVCGSRNRIGLNLRFETDGRIVQTFFTPGLEHNGFLNVTHGGLLATILDEVMVWACAIRTGKFSYSAEMTIRYLAPAPIHELIIATGELVENKREKLYLVKGELKSDKGVTLATSTGKYMPIRNIDYRALLADFEGTPEQLQKFLPSPA
jgi:acyl-coenzyme A thioesterase PaaI-like protein